MRRWGWLGNRVAENQPWGAILRLTDPTSGEVFFRDRNLAKLSPRELREQRRHLQIIFQDPYASLNPRMTVGQIVREPLETLS